MTSAERNAVVFFACLAAAGAGARLLGIGDLPRAGRPTAADRLALQHQLEVVDSAHAQHERGRAGKRGGKRAGARAGARGSRARPAVDGVPGSPPPAESSLPLTAGPRGPVDVNQADTAALNTLPGVGPALARRIVADRAAHGGYASMADLSRVRGIGAALERRLAGAVTFTPGGRPSSGSAGLVRAPRRAAAGGSASGSGRWPAP